MLQSADLPRPGDLVGGKYRVERVLGSGGMGVVVSAVHVQLEERVALKFLLADVPHEGEAGARFLREARAAVRIRNDHVVRVMDVGTLDGGAPYLVMEYLDGRDLSAELAERGRFEVAEAVDLVLQACEALAEAHALGIIHRDLKPANLFLTARANGALWVKVMDFGISKVPSAAHEPSMTRTQAVLGSPAYMSPEQLRSARDSDARTDIWALGVVLFQLVSGEVPFKGESISDLSIRIATERHERLAMLRPDVPPGFDAVIQRCLEKDREQRFQNIAELALALAPFATKQGRMSVENVVGVSGAPLVAASDSVRSSRVPSQKEKAVHARPRVETLASWGQTSGASRGGRRWLMPLALAAAAMAGVAGYSYSVRSAHPAASSSPSVDVQPPRVLASATSAVEIRPPSADTPARGPREPSSGESVELPSANASASAPPADSALPRVNVGAPVRAPSARPVKPRVNKPRTSTAEKPEAAAPAKPPATSSLFDSRKP